MNERGVGRGLAVFFEQNDQYEEQRTNDKSAKSVSIIDIKLIDENPYQPRKVFSDDAIASLGESIRRHGILQPIVVAKKDDDRYYVIAGERRLRAARAVGLDKIPCIVDQTNRSDIEMLELAILENIQRENLNVIEEAEAYKRLQEEFGKTQDYIAETTGKSRSHIANVIRLNTLPQEVKNLLYEGKLTFGHARALVGIPDAESVGQQIVDNDLSVRQVEKLVKEKRLSKNRVVLSEYVERSEIDEIKHHIASLLNLHVRVKLKKDGGTIEINFKNSSELDRFMQIINDKEKV